MGFGFLRKKRDEAISVEEAERRILNLIESAEKSIQNFASEKKYDLKTQVNKLIQMLEDFDLSADHPGLRNQAQNFVSAMLNLWKVNINFEANEIFDDISKKLEKVAFMKLKYFRMLFTVNPPEIEQIDQLLKSITGIVDDVNARRKEVRVDELRKTLEMIHRLKETVESKENAMLEYSNLTSQIENLKIEGESELSEKKEDEVTANLKREEERIASKLKHQEDELYRKIAYAKKPLKMYAHMVGVKINLDTHRFLDSLIEMKPLASGAVSEIRKGGLKLKEKKLDTVISSLEDISSGKMEKEFEKIKALREELRCIRNEIKKVQIRDRETADVKVEKNLKKRLAYVEETIKNTEREAEAIRDDLEKRLSDIFGKHIKIKMGEN